MKMLNLQRFVAVSAISLCVALNLPAQRASLRPASPIRLAGAGDSNNPVFRPNGRFVVFQSLGVPLYVEGATQTAQLKARGVMLNSFFHIPMWIEAVWPDEDGTLYAWYHHERWTCKSGLASPVIGALVSRDGGKTFDDLGIVLESGYAADCNASNGFFSSGHGDFTVLLDNSRQYFYFYFTNYSGPSESQGIAVARMNFSARARPLGQVWKYFSHSWTEPGLKGRVSAILPASASWSRPDTDSYWGPSIHWNTNLQQFVMLLNRSCCSPGWPQEGIYISYNPDLSIPENWTAPEKLLDAERARWYPQVIGIGPAGTDRRAGRISRFYMGGDSDFELVLD